jgi:hypothetical protein
VEVKWFGAGIRSDPGADRSERLVGVLLAALCYYVVASRGHSGARGAANGGHVHLSTTQRYVHFLKADLDDAALRLARFTERLEVGRGNGGVEARGQARREALSPRYH